VRLRDTPVRQTIEDLRTLATSWDNLLGLLSSPGGCRGDYMNAAQTTAGHLGRLFKDRAIPDAIYSSRYWVIARCEVLDREAQMLTTEIEIQRDRLRSMADELATYLPSAEREGTLVVPDTNSLVHYQRIDEIDWVVVTKSRRVRVVIVHTVLDELDDKRYAQSPRTAERARRAVKPLDERWPDLQATGFATLRADVTVEFLIDPPLHTRLDNADEEILDRSNFLAALTQREVFLATGDRGMRSRTAAYGENVRPLVLPDKYSKDQQSNES
jgi:rRNA-processing protein FCF1